MRRKDPIGMILRAEKLKTDIEAIFADQGHWNRVNPDKEPIDVDADGQLKTTWEYCDKLIEQLKLRVQ